VTYNASVDHRWSMLFINPKTEHDDLTTAQLRLLRRIVEEEYP